ncbi:MAG: hypothetical protein ACTSUE_11030 [Promethearchaeota archaeon]
MENLEAFNIHENGEYTPIEDINMDNVGELLKNEKEVYLILCPDFRRLYIWKGKNCPVQKKFVSSRVAQKLQRERVRNAGMQHKIVSIDEGDELDEFINNLKLKGVKTEAQRREEEKKKEEEEAKKFEELMKQPDIAPAEPKKEDAVQASPYIANLMKKAQSAFGPVYSPENRQGMTGMTDKQKQEILDIMLKKEVPAGGEREHLVLNGELYVNMKKMGKVFDKEIEIETWDSFNGVLEDGFMDIGNRNLRLYIKEGKIQAVEIFKPTEKITPSSLKQQDDENDRAGIELGGPGEVVVSESREIED